MFSITWILESVSSPPNNFFLLLSLKSTHKRASRLTLAMVDSFIFSFLCRCWLFFCGAPEARTRDQRIKSPMRYQLRQCSICWQFIKTCQGPFFVIYLLGGLLSRPPPLGLSFWDGQLPGPGPLLIACSFRFDGHTVCNFFV